MKKTKTPEKINTTAILAVVPSLRSSMRPHS